MYRSVHTATAIGLATWLFLWGAVVVGWFLNIFALAETGGEITGLFVARIVGIIFVPVGAILGWFF